MIAVGDAAYDGRTLFEIGSITKVFTGILLAEMAERGEVRLEQPVAELLPGDVVVPTRNGRQIRLVDLSTHSSGLPRMPDNFTRVTLAIPTWTTRWRSSMTFCAGTNCGATLGWNRNIRMSASGCSATRLRAVPARPTKRS